MVALSIAAWVLASTTDTDTDGEVGDAATGPTEPTRATETPTLEVTVERYVALGDSITSAPYLPEVDEAGGCLRSSQNYPHLIAERVRVPELVDVSCGGAATVHMSESQFPGVSPQLDAVTADTDLVTLTLGANDLSIYRTVVNTCVRLAARDFGGSPCRDTATADGGDLLLDSIEAVGPLIEDVLRQIHARAPDAVVVLVGYPRLFPTSGTCPETLPIASGDYPYLAAAMAHFNQVQSEAAAATGTEFLDMHAASEGHDACSTDPWMNGKDTVPAGTAAYHAFPEGQAAIADGILDLLR